MSDKFFDDVALLVSFDGANGDMTDTDDSNNAHTLTFNNGAALSNTQSVFGETSLLLDGSNDSVTVADAASLEIGSNDFTIEMYFRFDGGPPTGGSREATISKWVTSGNQRSWGFFISNSVFEFFYSTNGSSAVNLSDNWPVTLVVNQWYYTAVSRVGNTLRKFFGRVGIDANAEIMGTHDVTGASFFNSTADLAIGANNAGASIVFDGFIDEVRITIGTGRYVAAFPMHPGPFSKLKALGQTGQQVQPIIL